LSEDCPACIVRIAEGKVFFILNKSKKCGKDGDGIIDVCDAYIQGVTGGTDQTLGECSLGQTIPI
jgi:hypothetical protein